MLGVLQAAQPRPRSYPGSPGGLKNKSISKPDAQKECPKRIDPLWDDEKR